MLSHKSIGREATEDNDGGGVSGVVGLFVTLNTVPKNGRLGVRNEKYKRK